MAGNKPISDAAFVPETDVTLISGLAGFKSGTPNTNVKISGTDLKNSVLSGAVTSFTNAFGTFVTGTTNTSATGAVNIGSLDLSATGTTDSTTFLRGDNTWAVPPNDNDNTTYTLGTASQTTFGQIDLTPSTGSADAVTLTGAGTVSVASDASGAITITGSGGGGAASFTTLTPADIIDWDYATDGPNIVLTTGTTFENVLTVDDITEFPEGTEGWFIVTRDTNGVFKLPDEDDGSAVGITSLVPGGDISTGGSAPTVFHYVYDGETFWWTKFNNMEQPLNYPELPPGVDYTTADLLYYQDPRSYNTSSTTAVAVPNNTLVEDLSATNDNITGWRTTVSSSSYDIDFYPKGALVNTANPLGAAFYSFNGGTQNRIVRLNDYGAQISNTTTFSAWIQGPYNLSSAYQTLVDYDGGSSYVQALYLDFGEWVYSYSPVIANFTYPQLKNWQAASTSGLGTDLSNEWLFVNICNLPGSGTGKVKMGIGCKSSRDWAIANPPAVPGGTTNWDYEEGDGTGATVPVNADGMWFEEFTNVSNTETNIVNVNIFNGINAIAEDFEGHLGICGIFTKYLSNSDMTANFNATQGNYFT